MKQKKTLANFLTDPASNPRLTNVERRKRFDRTADPVVEILSRLIVRHTKQAGEGPTPLSLPSPAPLRLVAAPSGFFHYDHIPNISRASVC